MIKFKQGTITNNRGVTKDIIVKAASPNKLKDIIIGGGAVLVGITYLTRAAFRNGSKAFDKAEIETMYDLGIIHGSDNGTLEVNISHND